MYRKALEKSTGKTMNALQYDGTEKMADFICSQNTLDQRETWQKGYWFVRGIYQWGESRGYYSDEKFHKLFELL